MTDRYEAIPQELKNLQRWVCVWGNSKIPMRPGVLRGASSTDPSSWDTFDAACRAVSAGIYDDIGFVFNGDGIVGIDIDRGYDEDGTLSEDASKIMTWCNSYIEESRSGRGFHILLRGTLPFTGRNNRNGIEIYSSRRFFVMTGRYSGFGTKEICTNQDAIDRIVSEFFPDAPESVESTSISARFYSGVWERPADGKVKLKPSWPPVSKGSRNDSLMSVAGSMWREGYPVQILFRELLRINSEACSPPLTVREVQMIVNSITKYRR